MSSTSKRVLVVEDGITMRLFYRSVLEKAGFTVEEALNGVEGLERALLGGFDLLVVDVNMPKMDGYTMIRRLRDMPSIAHVPVVTISTEAGPADAERAIAAGSNLYIVKPADPLELTAAACLMTGIAA